MQCTFQVGSCVCNWLDMHVLVWMSLYVDEKELWQRACKERVCVHRFYNLLQPSPTVSYLPQRSTTFHNVPQRSPTFFDVRQPSSTFFAHFSCSAVSKQTRRTWSLYLHKLQQPIFPATALSGHAVEDGRDELRHASSLGPGEERQPNQIRKRKTVDETSTALHRHACKQNQINHM